MPTTWYEGTVVRIESAAPQTRRFWVQVPSLAHFDFTPGQFITMDLPIHEKRLHRWRSYSIASPPGGSNTFELCIVKLDGGRASEYLFTEVQEGSVLRFKGPTGTFTLPAGPQQELVLVCTGTGVAPFRSMLQHLVQHPQAYRGIHLIFGTRYPEGVLYGDEFSALTAQLPDFRYSVALSRVEEASLPALPFTVYPGYVHAVYEKYYSAPTPERRFLLCGWQNMVDEAVERLQALGYESTQIITELYG